MDPICKEIKEEIIKEEIKSEEQDTPTKSIRFHQHQHTATTTTTTTTTTRKYNVRICDKVKWKTQYSTPLHLEKLSLPSTSTSTTTRNKFNVKIYRKNEWGIRCRPRRKLSKHVVRVNCCPVCDATIGGVLKYRLQ